MSPIKEAIRLNGRWYALDGTRESVPDTPVVDEFLLEETQPTRAITGAGVIRPYPTIVVNGDVTAYPGKVVTDRIINGRAIVVGDGAFENCVIRGPLAAPTRAAMLVDTNQATPTSATVPLASLPDNLRFCDIIPQTPSVWWNAVGDRWWRVHRCYVEGATDGFRAHALTSGATAGYVGSRMTGCVVGGLTQWAPDTASNRAITHNDCLQVENAPADPTDLVISGNALDARPHPTQGTQPTQWTELAAIMLTANLDATVNGAKVRAISATITGNWLTGGIYTTNGGKLVTAGGYSRLIYSRNRHERPGAATTRPGPTAAVVLHPNYTVLEYADNVYIDTGLPAPRTNG